MWARARRASLLVLTLLVVALAHKAHAAQCGATLPANPTPTQVQNALNACGDGNYVQLSAGITSILSGGTIAIPCGVQLLGPATTPATAKLTTTVMFQTLVGIYGTCASANSTGLSYIDLDYGAGIEIDGNSHTNLLITHNQTTNLADTLNQPPNSITFDQGNGNTINGATIEYNTFGDANSCVNGQNNTTGPTGLGGCGVEIFSESNVGSHMVNLSLKYNLFQHLNEGTHFYGSCFYTNSAGTNCNGSTVNPNPINTCDNCDYEYNRFTQIHRIAIEWQGQAINHPFIMSHNEFDTYNNGFYGSYVTSTPCCQYGSTFGSPTISPSFLAQDNVEVIGASGNSGDAAEWGGEVWGNGTLFTNNEIQGNICAGATPGYSSGMSMSYNTIQGPLFPGTRACPLYSGTGAYIAGPEDAAGPVATITGNVESATPTSIPSIAPSVSPAGGAVTFPLNVTLVDNGYTSRTGNPYPNGNTGIWYTLDGSNPVPGAGTAKYAANGTALTLTSPATLKAVGMWGSPPQPTSYPTGYGFTPSSTVTVTYTSSGGAVTLAGIAITLPQASLTAGAAGETAAAICTYSDSSTTACGAAADSHGNHVTWASSTPGAAAITAAGVITPIAAGTTNISASLGVLNSNIVPLAVVASGAPPVGSSLVLGQNLEDYTGYTTANYFNSLYFVTGSTVTVPGNCHLELLGTVTSGAHYDCLLIAAPSATSEASTALCEGTYTTTSTAAPGTITIPMTGCPATLPANTAYWVATITNDPASSIPMGFYDCGGTCGSTVPTSGAGAYYGQYVAVTYGAYTSLPASFAGTNPKQPTQWIDLTQSGPTLVSAYQNNQGSINTMVYGSGGYQMKAWCVYSDAVIYECDTAADARGNQVTAWTAANAPGGVSVIAIGAIGSAHPGLVTGVAYGTANAQCTVTGGIACSPWTWTVTNAPSTHDTFVGVTLENVLIH